MTSLNMPPAPDLRPEARLLLCCARARMDSETAAQMRVLLRQDIEWTYVLRTALRYGMRPLLYWHLKAICPEAIPKSILDQLRDYFYLNFKRNLFLAGELLTLLKLFMAHGITALPYKGPVLATSVYKNLALRQFRDLDILVRKRDVRRAKDLLASQGYRLWPQLAGPEAAYLRSQCQYSLARDDGRVIVELHWGITPRYFAVPLDPACLWERLEPTSFLGTPILTFSPENLLLILCVHGTKHLWERLEWICGVAELIRTGQQLDWGWVLERAGELGSERMLLLGLFLAADLLGAALPAEVWQKVQADPSVKVVAGKVRQWLFLETDDPPDFFERLLFHCMAREQWRDRLRYCFRLATTLTHSDWAMLPLPVSFSPVYYCLRPIRLIGKYGLSRFRR